MMCRVQNPPLGDFCGDETVPAIWSTSSNFLAKMCECPLHSDQGSGGLNSSRVAHRARIDLLLCGCLFAMKEFWTSLKETVAVAVPQVPVGRDEV